MQGYRKFIVTLYGLSIVGLLAMAELLSPAAVTAITGLVAGYVAVNLYAKSKSVIQ